MRPLRQYRPIEFRQVCAITRAVFHREQPADDASWKEAVKTTCAQQGYDEPSSEMLARALSAVEHALAKDGYVRTPHQVSTTEHDSTRPAVAPLTQSEAKSILADLGAQAFIKAMPNVRPRTVREMEIHKAAALIAQAIVEQVQRCEEAERAVDEEAQS